MPPTTPGAGAAGNRPTAGLADQTLPQGTPKAKLGQALHYLQVPWSVLVSHRVDGRYPIENNAIENAIQLFVIGLKNSMFSKPPAGANRNGLIETGNDHGIEPYASRAPFLENCHWPRPWTILTNYFRKRSRA